MSYPVGKSALLLLEYAVVSPHCRPSALKHLFVLLSIYILCLQKFPFKVEYLGLREHNNRRIYRNYGEHE